VGVAVEGELNAVVPGEVLIVLQVRAPRASKIVRELCFC
jgi:hypothetical protein